MRTVLFVAILLIVASVPAAYASTLQLVTENGNVFSIDFDEILFLWEMQNPSNQTQTITAIQQEIADLRTQLISITNTTDVGSLQDRIDELQEQLNSNSTSTDAAITLLESQIGMLREQLTMALTNSTATDTEIEMLRETIATLTTDLENLEQDGIGAGALGTSGRMVSAALDGYVIYGEHGKLGTITEATTYNRYTGPVDYVGIIPDKDYFTKYSLDSPNGQYTVHNSELVPAPGSSKWVRTNGDKVLEGSAPVINNHGRDVEIDVSGKVLVQLDESRLGNGAVIGVDTEGVTAQVVTSPNDLINTEYRDFNGTGKFVLFEGEAQRIDGLSYYKNSVGNTVRWHCSNVGSDNCTDDAGPYSEWIFRSGSLNYYALLGDNDTAVPHSLDVYVSTLNGSFVDSNTTVPATHGRAVWDDELFANTFYLDGIYETISSFANGLWHLTEFSEGAGYSATNVQNLGQARTITGAVTGFGAAQGTHRVTDATPYVVQGSVEPAGSKNIPTLTDSNVYVLLESIGNDQTYTVSNLAEDITLPTVLSIERHSPSGLVTDSDMLIYKITFSEDVIGVDADDFLLSPISTSGTNTTSLTKYLGAPSIGFSRVSTTETITVTDEGTDMLVALFFDWSRWTPYTTLSAPDGTSVRVVPDRQPQLFDFGNGNITGDWRARFHNSDNQITGAVTNLSLTVIPRAAPNPVTSVSGSGSVYYATVPASREGTYAIDLRVDHNIKDAAGNILVDRIPVSDIDRVYGVTAITDLTSPTVLSIERHNPTVQNTNSRTLTYEVTFSEAVTGMDVFDFVFSPDSTGNNGNSPVTSISGSGDTYRVTVPADTDGTYNIDLVPSGHGIVDAVSNPLTDTVPATGIDHTYVSTSGRDNTRPTVSSIDRYDPTGQYTNSTTLVYKVEFSEDVTGVDEDDFVLSPGSTGKALLTPTNWLMQTNSPALDIPYRITVSDTITVLDYGTIATVGVTVDIAHPNTSALKVDLVVPDSTVITLHDRANLGSNLRQTYMIDLDGMQMAGDWVLQVYSYGGYGGDTVNAWGLTINHGSNRELGPVASLSGSGDTYYATIFATQNGTYNLDLTPSGHGIEDTAGNRLTDTSIAAGTARISANGIVGAGDVRINGLPGGVPWVFETIDGQQLSSGLTSSSGSINMPLPDYSIEGITGELSMLVYEDGFGHNVQPGNLVADLLNGEFIRYDFGNPSQNVIYIPERYMLYPITVPVTINDVRLGKLTTDCNVSDQVRLPYIDGSYDAGSSMYVPFIPGMSALKFSIDGAPVCVKFADVLPPVQIVTFVGDVATGREAPVIDLTVGATASAILATNDPASLVVSFGASGFSEHSRIFLSHQVRVTGNDGSTLLCYKARVGNNFHATLPSSCPYPANTMLNDVYRTPYLQGYDSLANSFTTYEVAIDVFKNGQLYDTVTLPINSLVALTPADIGVTHGLGYTQYLVPYTVNQTTVAGGHHYYGQAIHHYNRPLPVYQAMMGTSWSEVLSHTFDITDGKTGDHIEVYVSNRIIFNFPYPYGNYHSYNTEGAHYTWPSAFETEIVNGDEFLGPNYDKVEYIVQVDYEPHDRGVLVAINDGTLMLVSTR